MCWHQLQMIITFFSACSLHLLNPSVWATTNIDTDLKNPPFLARIPSIICWWGNRSGNLVQLSYRRELLDYASITSPAYTPLNGIYNYGLRLSYLSPLWLQHLDMADRLVPDRAFLRSRSQAGVIFGNLWPLEHVPLQRTNGGAALSRSRAPDSTTVKMALLNARSILNKTFIINDFFTSQNLDCMFVIET